MRFEESVKMRDFSSTLSFGIFRFISLSNDKCATKLLVK